MLLVVLGSLKMKLPFARGLKASFAAAVALCGAAVLSLPASATYDYYHWQTQQAAAADPDTINGDIVLNPGVYDPFVIGDDIEFNACSTTFAGYSLCDLPDTSRFTIQWQAQTQDENGNTMLYDSGTCNPWGSSTSSDNCLNVTIPGDTTSNIYTSDTFFVGIHIATWSNFYIPLPNGEWAYTGGGGQDGWMWTSIARTASVSNGGGGGPVSVPEPWAPLLLLPALALVWRRERRRMALAAA